MPFIGFSEALRPHSLVLGSVPMASVKAQLDAPRGEHLEAAALVALQDLPGEVGIEILGHSKISLCNQ